MSPPCVAHFDGDNGGDTYRGVTGDEIRILMPIDAGGPPDSDDAGRYFDLQDPEDDPNSLYRPGLRALLRYFNNRYQTYGRVVRAYVYYTTDRTPEQRRADASDNLEKVDPAAIVTSGFLSGGEETYIESVTDRGVLSFGSSKGPALSSVFTRNPGQVWSYTPTVETVADRFSRFVCERVVPYRVVDSGNEQTRGSERVLGFLSTSDPNYPNLQHLARLVRAEIEACGADIAADGTFPQADRFFQYGGKDPAAAYARDNMARFQAAGVTTVIWPGGFEADQSKAAQAAGYLPEWIVAGDGLTDAAVPNHQQGQQAWAHATVATYNVRADSVPDGTTTDYSHDPHFHCAHALLEGNPETDAQDIATICNTSFYEDLRQLFNGIQVAGPQLTPATVDRGFHAIPAVESASPHVPACFYRPGDYTCIKDAMVQWWDPGNRQEGYANDGCYRMVEDGRRRLAWRDENIDARRQPADPCNRFNRLAFAF